MSGASSSSPHGVRARQAEGQAAKAGRAPNKRGTSVRFRPDPQIFGPKAAFQPERVFKMTRSKAYLFGGVEIRWSCAKELLRGIEDVPEKATFHFEEGLKDYLSRDAARRDAGASRHLHRHRRQDRRARRRAMGGGLDRRCRRVSQFLLQHHPDARRRHPRIRLAQRVAARAEGSRRARRPGQARRRHHRGRRHDRRRRHALGVHPRAGIPGPDQGSPRHRRSAAHRRAGDQGPVRPLARRQSDAGQQAVRLRGRARRRAHPPPPGKGYRAQVRGAQTPSARKTRRLHQWRGRRLRDFCRRGRLRRRLGQAGARSPLASHPAAARQNPQRGVRRQGQARAKPAARRPRAGARLRHRRALQATRICATAGSSS